MNIKFQTSQQNFMSLLRKRVNQHFNQGEISQYGNFELYLKGFILMLLLISLYLLPLIFTNLPVSIVFLIYFIQGIVFALVGFNVMHDGSHKSFSKRKSINVIMAHTLNVLGGSALFWHQKHVMNHHTYTNIEGLDDDIDIKPFIRLSEHQSIKWYHRFQQYYALVLYCFTYIFWIYYRDFKKYFTRMVAENTPMVELEFTDHLIFWTTKVIHISIFLVIPSLIIGPLLAITGYIVLSLICGFTLAVVFQLAHIVEGTIFSAPEVAGDDIQIESEWSIYQINTTVNFATDNKILTWLLGGLNYQMVHHLFPKISHIHYPALHNIILQTCEEHNVEYVQFDSFWSAFLSHLRHLKEMGKG